MKDKCEKLNLDLSEDLRFWGVYTVIKMMVSICRVCYNVPSTSGHSFHCHG